MFGGTVGSDNLVTVRSGTPKKALAISESYPEGGEGLRAGGRGCYFGEMSVLPGKTQPLISQNFA